MSGSDGTRGRAESAGIRTGIGARGGRRAALPAPRHKPPRAAAGPAHAPPVQAVDASGGAQSAGTLLPVLGARVRGLRADRRLTRRMLAERSGLSERFVAELEAGRANISVLNLAQVARVLGVTPASLLEGAGDASVQSARRVVSLLGLRGAGKSTVGRKLAERMGVQFFELDRLVEAEAGMLLPEIFAIHGEEYFRRLELAALKRFLTTHDCAVLATGGGIVQSTEAFQLLLDRTRTVWLRAQPEEHWERVVHQGDLRPMQNRPHAMAELRRRLKEREPLYGRAEFTLMTTGREVDDLARELANSVHSR